MAVIKLDELRNRFIQPAYQQAQRDDDEWKRRYSFTDDNHRSSFLNWAKNQAKEYNWNGYLGKKDTATTRGLPPADSAVFWGLKKQYDYNQERRSTQGKGELKFGDYTYDPYKDADAEERGEFYSKYHRPPTTDELTGIKTEKLAKERRRTAQLEGIGYDPNSVRNQWQWDKTKYTYDPNDPDDIEREKQGLRPASLLAEYGNSPEDKRRKQLNLPPLRIERTERLLGETKSYNDEINALVANGQYSQEAAEATRKKYRELYNADELYKKGLPKDGDDEKYDPKKYYEPETDSLSNYYDIEALKANGYDPATGFKAVAPNNVNVTSAYDVGETNTIKGSDATWNSYTASPDPTTTTVDATAARRAYLSDENATKPQYELPQQQPTQGEYSQSAMRDKFAPQPQSQQTKGYFGDVATYPAPQVASTQQPQMPWNNRLQQLSQINGTPTAQPQQQQTFPTGYSLGSQPTQPKTGLAALPRAGQRNFAQIERPTARDSYLESERGAETVNAGQEAPKAKLENAIQQAAQRNDQFTRDWLAQLKYALGITEEVQPITAKEFGEEIKQAQTSAPAAFIYGAGDTVTMGAVDVLQRQMENYAQKTGYNKPLPSLDRINEAKTKNPVATQLGEMAGMFVPAVGIEGMATKVLTKVAPKLTNTIVKGAIAGGFANALQGGVYDINKGKDAKEVMTNLVMNALLGSFGDAGIRMVGDMATGFVPKAGSAMWKVMLDNGTLIKRLEPAIDKMATAARTAASEIVDDVPDTNVGNIADDVAKQADEAAAPPQQRTEPVQAIDNADSTNMPPKTDSVVEPKNSVVDDVAETPIAKAEPESPNAETLQEIKPTIKEPWSMTKEELLAEKAKLEASADADYWRFSRTSSSKVGVGNTNLERLNDIKTALGESKQPWQKTYNDFSKLKPISKEAHKKSVEIALERKKPVPKEVLADYPDLINPKPQGVEKLPKKTKAPTKQVKPEVDAKPTTQAERTAEPVVKHDGVDNLPNANQRQYRPTDPRAVDSVLNDGLIPERGARQRSDRARTAPSKDVDRVEVKAEADGDLKIRQARTNTFERAEDLTDADRANMPKEKYAYTATTNEAQETAAKSNVKQDIDRVVKRLDETEGFTNGQQSFEAHEIALKYRDEALVTGDYTKYNRWMESSAVKIGKSAEAMQGWDAAWKKTAEGKIATAQQFVKKSEEIIGKPAMDAVNKQADEIKTTIDKLGDEATDQIVKEIKQKKTRTTKGGDGGTGGKGGNSTPKEPKEYDPAEDLANKIINTQKPKKPQEIDIVKEMVKELFTVAKEAPINVKNAGLNKLTSLQKTAVSIRMRREYASVWAEAKKIVKEAYADNPEALAALDAYFDKGIRPPHSMATFESAFKTGLKDLKIDMGDVVKKYYSKGTANKEGLIDYLVKESGLTADDAKSLANEIDARWHTLRKEKSEAYLAKVFGVKPPSVKQTGKNLADIEALSNTGGFENKNYLDKVNALLPEKLNKIIKGKVDINELVRKGMNATEVEKVKLVKELSEQLAIKETDLRTVLDVALKEFDGLATVTRDKILTSMLKPKVKGVGNPIPKGVRDVQLFNDLGGMTNPKFQQSILDALPEKIATVVKAEKINLDEIVRRGKDLTEQSKQKFVQNLSEKLNMEEAELKVVVDTALKKFDALADEKKLKILDSMFVKRALKKPKTEFEKVMELINLGAYDNAAIRDILKTKKGYPVLDQPTIETILLNFNEAQKHPVGSWKYRAFMSKADQAMISKLEITGWEKLNRTAQTSMLFALKTMLFRNFGGNVMNDIIKTALEVPGAVLDMGIGKLTGVRSTYMPNPTRGVAKVQGAAKGFWEQLKDIRYGVDTSPFKAMGELPKGKTFKSDAANFLPDTAVNLLKLGDRPIYQAQMDDMLKAMQKDIAKGKVTAEEAAELAEYVAQRRTFQDKNAISEGIRDIKSGANKLTKGYTDTDKSGLGSVVMPFTQTGGSILDQGLENVIGVAKTPALIKQIRNATTTAEKMIAQRKLVDAITANIGGVIMAGTAATLAGLGVITGRASENKNEADADAETGLLPYSVNEDALGRLIRGEDPKPKRGDRYSSYQWAMPAAFPVALGADVKLNADKDEGGIEAFTKGVATAAQSAVDLSLFQGVVSLFAGGDLPKGILNTLAKYPSQFIPQTARSIGQLIDDNQRQTYDPNWFVQTGNQIKSQIPGLSKDLNEKISTTGKEVKMYNGENSVWNVLFNPSRTATYEPVPAIQEAKRLLKATDDSGAFPTLASKKIQYQAPVGKGYLPKTFDLTADEYEYAQRTLGQRTVKLMNEIMKTDEYKKLTDKEKLNKMKGIIEESKDYTKYMLLKRRRLLPKKVSTFEETVKIYAKATGATQEDMREWLKAE
jgi:hypothetical protein